MHNFTSINDIDGEKAQLLVDASIQAYKAFDKKSPSVCHSDRVTPPAGYDLVDSWTGVDAIFGHDKTVECYGLVFRSQSSPYTYIFSFRGTSSLMDMVDDLGAEKMAFSPFDFKGTIDAGVEVESGFFDVYRNKDGDTDSMQNQVFGLIDKYNKSSRPIAQLLITGHSLGAALSQLFTLDLALSRPDVVAMNYNYASPRVGNADFVTFYEKQAAQQNPATRTIRIQNTHDKVPCVPPGDLKYSHTPYAYLIAFSKEEPHRWDIDFKFIVHNHSVENYQSVIDCAAAKADGICAAELEADGGRYKVTSKKPDPGDICSFW